MSEVGGQPAVGSKPPGRLRYVDGLRGVAAMWVATFHLHTIGRVGERLAEVLPAPLLTLFHYGDRGVDIFFVLSGFVIALSIRNARVDWRYAGNFFLRRSVRLDPPYWLCIALVISLNALSRAILPMSAAELPPPSQIVANVFYLQDILGVGSILTVFWTLCLELQFYLVLIALVGLSHAIAGDAGTRPRALTTVAIPAAVVALAVPAGWITSPRGLFLSHWYMFLVGALTLWTLDGLLRQRWLLGYFAALLAIAVAKRDVGAGLALAVALSLFAAGRWGRLEDGLGWRWLQHLGAISYSIYLLHLPIGGRGVSVLSRLLPDGPAGAVMAFAGGLAVTVIAAHFGWLAIERPFLSLSRRFREPATTGSPDRPPSPGTPASG